MPANQSHFISIGAIKLLNTVTHEHIITHQHFFSSSQFGFAWTMLISHIIQVLLFITHQLIFLFYFFSSTHPPPPHYGWLTANLTLYVHFHPIFLSRLTFVQFGIHSVLFHPTHGLFCFILCYLSWVYTFSIMFIPHCKYFFF